MKNGKIKFCPTGGCDFKCCDFDQGNYIVLFPDEIQSEDISHLKIIDESYIGGMKAVCHASDKKTCDGKYKPFDCRMYPVFPRHNGVYLKGKKCPLRHGDILGHIKDLEESVLKLSRWQRYNDFLRDADLVGYEYLNGLMTGYSYPKSKLRKWSAEDPGRVYVVWENIKVLISRDRVMRYRQEAVDRIRKVCRDKRAFYGYSGGKDSMTLSRLCADAGVTVGQQVLCQPELEFKAMEDFYDLTRPANVIVQRTHQDLGWIKKDIRRLFPADSVASSVWYSPKWALHHRFAAQNAMDVFLVGRRLIDGNMVGKSGIQKSKDGLITFNPIFDWDHEMLFAFMAWEGLPVPPYFQWPDGFKFGNEPWANRRWSDDINSNWNIVCGIEPDLENIRAKMT